MTRLEEMFNWLDSVEYDHAWSSVGKKFMESVEPEMVKEFIIAICEDESRLQTLYRRSYIHPLGFYKLEIYKSTRKLGFAVRLHYWPPGLSASNEDIHDHCFHFFSRVFVGEMCHEVFVKANEGLNYEEIQYSVDDKFNSTYKVLGCQKLANQRRLSIVDGIYYMDANTLHKVIVNNPPCLSLLLRSPYLKKSAAVYRSYVHAIASKGKQLPERFSTTNSLKDALLNMHHQLVANKKIQPTRSSLALLTVG